MPLADQFAELDSIAQMIQAEHQIITCMRSQSEPPTPESEARCYAAGLAEIALLLPVMQLAALELEQVNAWVAQP